MIGSRRDYSGLCPVKDYFMSGDEPQVSDTTEFVRQSTRPCYFILLKRAATHCRIIRQPGSAAAISASGTKHSRAAKSVEGVCNRGSIEEKIVSSEKERCVEMPLWFCILHIPIRPAPAMFLFYATRKRSKFQQQLLQYWENNVLRKLYYFLNGYLWVCTSSTDHHYLPHFSNQNDYIYVSSTECPTFSEMKYQPLSLFLSTRRISEIPG